MIDQLARLGPRAARAFVALKRDIDRGRYAVGARLPAEDALVTQTGVSRTALRRAVAALVELGLLDVRQGSGTYLRRLPASGAGATVVSLMYNFDGGELTEIQDYLLARGLLMCVYSQGRTHWDPAKERRFLRRVREEGHRALLAFCSPLAPHSDRELARLAAAGTRVLHIEHYRVEPPDQEYLLPDYRRAGHMAAVELMLAGYERILFLDIAPAGAPPYSRLYEAGVADALEEHGHGYEPARDRFDIGPAFHEHPEMQARLAATVRAAGSVGMACTSSRLAAIVRASLVAQGLAVPDRVGLIGPVLVGRASPDDGTTALVFDRARLLKRAIHTVLGPREPAVREWVSPRLRPGGTVRGRARAR